MLIQYTKKVISICDKVTGSFLMQSGIYDFLIQYEDKPRPHKFMLVYSGSTVGLYKDIHICVRILLLKEITL